MKVGVWKWCNRRREVKGSREIRKERWNIKKEGERREVRYGREEKKRMEGRVQRADGRRGVRTDMVQRRSEEDDIEK